MGKFYNFNRRRFILNSGATLLLPTLECFYGRDSLFAQVMEQPLFIGMFMGNGMVQSNWMCSGTENDWTLGTDLQGLAANKSNITVVHNLSNRAHEETWQNDNDVSHWCEAPTFLTGSGYNYATRTENTATLNYDTRSIDQIIASTGTAFPNPTGLAFGIGPKTSWNDGRGNYRYRTNISYLNKTTVNPNRAENSFEAFRQVFGVDPGAGGTAATVEVFDRKKSILDGLLTQETRFLNALGAADKERMDRYFTALREYEVKLASEAVLREIVCDQPSGDYESANAEASVKAMLKRDNYSYLITTAFSCGITRVATFMCANAHAEIIEGAQHGTMGITDSFAGFAGHEYAHHDASHYTENESDKNVAGGYVQFQVSCLNRMLLDLDAAGLLSRTVVVFGSGMGDSQDHGRSNIPMIIGGSGGGLNPGRLLSKSDDLRDIMRTILDKFNVPAAELGEVFGDSTKSKVLDYL